MIICGASIVILTIFILGTRKVTSKKGERLIQDMKNDFKLIHD